MKSPDVETMFKEVLASDLPERSHDFITSIQSYWERFSELTPKQLAALEKFYDNIQFRKGGFQK